MVVIITWKHKNQSYSSNFTEYMDETNLEVRSLLSQNTASLQPRWAESQVDGSNGNSSPWFACLWSNSQTPGFGKMIGNIFQIFTFSQFHINEAGKPCLPNRIEKLLLKSEELNGDF